MPNYDWYIVLSYTRIILGTFKTRAGRGGDGLFFSEKRFVSPRRPRKILVLGTNDAQLFLDKEGLLFHLV